MSIDEERRLNFVTQQSNRVFLASGERTSEAAFESVAMPYLKELYCTALRLLLDVRKASDAVQETYRRGGKEFENSERANCRLWMFQILFDSVRRARHDSDSPTIPVVPLGDRKILSGMDRLPHELREVLLLVDVQRFSYAEASTILDIGVETLKSRIGRARMTLYREAS